jgi:hypothetical protein
VFPSAPPEILTGIRISLGVGWGTLVAAELIAATRGIGFLRRLAALGRTRPSFMTSSRQASTTKTRIPREQTPIKSA